MDSLAVTTRLLPTLALLKLPTCVIASTSPGKVPTKVPLVMVVAVVPSYTLDVTTEPVTVNVTGVMLAVVPLCPPLPQTRLLVCKA